MHLFDPARPKTASSQPQIIGEPSVIPHVMVSPQKDGRLLLCVLLRNYTTETGYSYRFHYSSVEALPEFFRHYTEDPEAALLLYFDWSAKSLRSKQEKTPPPFRTDLITSDLF